MDLAMQLVQDHMKSRLTITTIPLELRTTIRRILRVPEKEEEDTEREVLTKKRRMTKYLCLRCKKPVCIQCTKPLLQSIKRRLFPR